MDENSTHDQVRRALSSLVTRGAESIWTPEVHPLLELPAVRTRIAKIGEDRAAEALLEVLSKAIDELEGSQYRVLLTIVLEIDPEYRGLSAGERRSIAGRRFRGGARPVSAGTIRQHHEPRALDLLTEELVKSDPHTALERTTDPTPTAYLEWHPDARAHWEDEHLTFWRLSLANYDREKTPKRVIAVLDELECRAWRLYELVGQHQMLLRVWTSERMITIEEALRDVFPGDPVMTIEHFEVAQIVEHWPWTSEAETMPRVSTADLDMRPSNEQIALANTKTNTAGLRTLFERGVLTSVAEGDGIEFFVELKRSWRPPPRAIVEGLQDTISRLLSDVPTGFSELSLYRGSEGSFAFQGRMRPEVFHQLTERLLQPLHTMNQMGNWRIETSIMATPHAIAASETLRAIPERQLSASNVLRRGVDETHDIRGAAFVDMHRWLLDPDSGDLPTKSAATTQSLIKAVTGLLNANGGTLVIGAIEANRYSDDPRLRDAPRIGSYLVTGIGHEQDHGFDGFELQLRQAIRAHITPDPTNLLRLDIEVIEGVPVCVLTILRPSQSRNLWYYAEIAKRHHFMVRRGSVTEELSGAEADAYRVQLPREWS